VWKTIRRTAAALTASTVAVTALCSPAAHATLPRPEATAMPPLAADVNIQPASLSIEQLTTAVDRAQAVGASIITAGVNWRYLRPSADKAYAWGPLDRLAAHARARDIRLRLQLAGLPDWARDRGRPSVASAPWYPPTSTAERRRWAGFVKDVGTRYADVAAYLEIWNEPNSRHFWYGDPNPAVYGRLLAASYRPIRTAAPAAKILFGGLSRNDLGYLTAVYRSLDVSYPNAARDGHFFDILSIHPYSDNRSPRVSDAKHAVQERFGIVSRNFTGYSVLKRFLEARREPGKKLYIGEYGFSTTGAWGYPGVPDTQRAQYLAEAYGVARDAGYIEAFGWYCFITTNVDGADWAMLDSAFQPNATYRALQNVLAVT
jgi:hypothetical protein